MSNNCKYLKIKINKKLECKRTKKEIKIRDCTNCKFKTWKYTELNNNQMQESPLITGQTKRKSDSMKKKSNKLAKLERERFSLFSDRKDKCYFCPSTCNLTWHEIFRGRNRSNSMRYGLCLRMCLNCHDKYQEDKSFNDNWHKKGQRAFEQHYPDLKFEDIFKINYL